MSHHEIASPAESQDRFRFLIGAQPTDSDKDVSEDEGEDSFSGQVRADKRGSNKDGEDETDEDVDKEILDELDEDEKGEQDKVDERDADLSEEEETYKKRFADTKADRDEKVRLLRETMVENARLKALQVATSDINEEQLAREVQEGIYAEVSKITETDPTKRTKAAYDVVGKFIASSTKKAVELALNKVQTQRTQETQATEQMRQGREAASKLARIALKEIGLDSEKHFPLFQKEVDRQMERDPDWFKAIPAEQHFVRLAERIKARLDSNRKANDEHRREAGGQLNTGTRVTRPNKSKSDNEDTGELDTMRGAMGMATKANLLRGRKAFQLANVQR